MSHNGPTKVGHGVVGKKRMLREIHPRAPQVSVVTQTIYASSTSTATSSAVPTTETGMPLGPVIGGMVGGMIIVLLAVGGWYWWGSRVRAAKAKGAKARRAQDLAVSRAAGKSASTEILNTQPSSISEKSGMMTPASEPVKKPSAILAEKPKPNHPRLPFNQSTSSLGSSKYAPTRPSPLAAVTTRSPSVMSDNLPIPTNGMFLPSVNVVPPSPPPPPRALLAPEEPSRGQRQSVQSVQTIGSEYSTESAVGVAYGGDETEREAYKKPRDEWMEARKSAGKESPRDDWLESKKSAVGRVRPPQAMRR